MDGFEAPTGHNVARDQDTEERADLSPSPRQQPHQGRLGGHASRWGGWRAPVGARLVGPLPQAALGRGRPGSSRSLMRQAA